MREKSSPDGPAIDRTYRELVNQGFPLKKLLVLVESCFFEDNLWPQFQESNGTSSTLLAVWILNTKKSLGRPTFQSLTTDAQCDDPRISILLQNVFHASLDEKLTFKVRTACLLLIIDAFENLDILAVQKSCQPVVSILCWQYLLSTNRDKIFETSPLLRKRYKTRIKAIDSANDSGHNLRFASGYCYKIGLLIIVLLNTQRNDQDTLIYCCKVVELFTELLSQLPTRRYIIYLLKDLHILTAIRSSYRFVKPTAVQDIDLKFIVGRLDHCLSIPFDDIGGQELTQAQVREGSDQAISRLQQVAFTVFKESLLLLALSNHATIDIKTELHLHLEGLSDDQLASLCDILAIRTSYHDKDLPKIERSFLEEAIAEKYERTRSYRDSIRAIALFPTEQTLFGPQYALHVRGKCEMVLPKLTLQYLSINDFLQRVLEIHQASFFQSVRTDIIAGLQRLAPQIVYPSRTLNYKGSSKNILPIDPPAMLEVAAPRIGSPGHPSSVLAEVRLDLEELSSTARSEWLDLRSGDIVYFIHLDASDDTSINLPSPDDPDYATKIGIVSVRSATVESILEVDGRPIRPKNKDNQSEFSNNTKRLLRVRFDPVAFQKDKEQTQLENVYEKLNLLMKRRDTSNRDLSIMQNIQTMAGEQKALVPEWLKDPFLGFGMVNGASELSDPADLGLYDSLIDSSHAREAFPELEFDDCRKEWSSPLSGQDYSKLTNPVLRQMLNERGESIVGVKSDLVLRLEEAEQRSGGASRDPAQAMGDYIFTLSKTASSSSQPEVSSGSKRKRGDTDPWQRIRCDKVQLRGPYMSDRPRRNSTRFSSSQLRAICAGTAPGLTLIDGVPGSGKGSIAAQIISNVYHNEADKRILVLCKTSSNVNALSARLRRLDINHSHILQLQATANKSLGLDGSLATVLQQKKILLNKVSQLAFSLDLPGAHGGSCETAAYFYSTIIRPRLAQMSQRPEVNETQQSKSSPFAKFFSDTQEQSGLTSEDDLIKSHQTCIENIFSQLSELRPLELLKDSGALEAHLLSKSARIILTTAADTIQDHARLTGLGIAFHTVLIDQASSLTDFEAISPFTIIEDAAQISRFVLIGDSSQIKAIATGKNPDIALATNAGQSLFSRLLRTGNNVVKVNEQARARPQLAALYQHQYSEMKNLPNVATGAYLKANAGFHNVCQFVQVPNYNGQGEFSPRKAVWQNLGEAEYLVALYQYMRLLNYPIESITLLTPFDGQKALIQDILDARCRSNPFFGIPLVATVEEYQGQESDYVLLSLVRTSPAPELLDTNMMTTALSRARLGLYVFGRRGAMPSVLNPFLSKLDIAKDAKLELVTGEMYPTTRLEEDKSERIAVMEGVEHLGKYVYEMTQKRLASVSKP